MAPLPVFTLFYRIWTDDIRVLSVLVEGTKNTLMEEAGEKSI